MADGPPRHRIEVACPECGHVQSEPSMVISTQCRSCLSHFQVHEGKGVSRVRPATRLVLPQRDPESDATPPASSLPPSPPPASSYFRREPPPPPPKSFFMRLFHPDKPPREVTCFSCSHSYQASGDAQSTQCTRCSGYISLLDYDINTLWNRRIQTCGDVIIQKSGTVTGVTLHCRNLTVLGELAGSVNCTGDLIIRSHGKIIGKVQCHNLRVEKGARVEFLNPVTATTAFIDGNVRGQITCSGIITLEKRAQLHGLVRTSSLVVKPGAKHTGTIEMVQREP